MADTKPFDRKLWKENDKKAKVTAVDFIESTGVAKLKVPLDEQPERYKAGDFEAETKKGKTLLFEAERKRVWVESGKWQGYPTIDFPGRKAASKADYFVMVNEHLDTLCFIPGDKVRKAPAEPKNTRNQYNGQKTEGELFLRVPLTDAVFFHKQNGKWKKVKP